MLPTDPLLAPSGAMWFLWVRGWEQVIFSIRLLMWILCRILFYPPLAYTGWLWLETSVKVKRSYEEQGELEVDVGEHTHLLGEGS
jgi:hypothetical protein